MVFWAIDERKKKLTAREIDTLTELRERLQEAGNSSAVRGHRGRDD